MSNEVERATQIDAAIAEIAEVRRWLEEVRPWIDRQVLEDNANKERRAREKLRLEREIDLERLRRQNEAARASEPITPNQVMAGRPLRPAGPQSAPSTPPAANPPRPSY